MSISIQSTSDTPEAVTAALGDLAKGKPAAEEKKETQVKANEDAGESAELSEEAEHDENLESEENEAEESEELTEDETPEDQKPKSKKQNGFKKKIDKKNQVISTLTQEKEYWREQALRNQNQQAPKPDPSSEIKPDPSKRPVAANFESHDEYLEALTDWKVDQREQARERKQKEESAKSEVQKKIEQHKERVEKFSAAHDDWEETLDSVGKVQLSLAVQEAIVDSDHGPEIMYELAKHQDELKRICALSPIKAAKEIGRLEAKFSKSSESSEKKVSKAPAPVNPVRSRGSVVKKSIDDPNLSQKEYEQLRAEQLKSRRA